MPKTTCTPCGGRGSYDVIGERACSGCAGSGRDLNSDLYLLPCSKCRGSRRESYYERRTCSPCSGTGYINY